MNETIQLQKIAQLTGHKAAIYTLVEGSTVQYVYSAAGDGWVVQWDLDDPKMGKLIAKVETNIFSLAYIKRKNLLVVGNMNGGIHWVYLDQPEQNKDIDHHKNGVFDIQEIEGFIFTAGGEGMLTKWSIEEGRSLESLHITNESLRCIRYHKERKELIVAASDNSIYILDIDDFGIKQVISNAHNNSVFSLQLSADAKHLISGSRDAQLNVWSVEENYEAFTSIPAHMYTINSMALHPKGHLLATASRDKTIKIWDAYSFKLLKVIDTIRDGGHVNSVNKILWSTHENKLISCSDDRTLIIWNVELTV